MDSDEEEDAVPEEAMARDEQTQALIRSLIGRVLRPMPTVDDELFDYQYTYKVLIELFGLYVLQSYELRYHYYMYPHIRSEQVFDDPSLRAMQNQMQLQNDSEYCFSFSVNTSFVRLVCQRGCFPLGHTIHGVEAILVKLHHHRCAMLDLNRLHVSRNVRKKSKKYAITVNGHYQECARRIHQYHSNSWLNPKLTQVFDSFHTDDSSPVRVLSFELWNVTGLDTTPTTLEDLHASSATFVAGELGYAVGGNYTSLTGYHTENHSGTIQLVGTGKLLQRMGYRMWDFGMTMDYKIKLGAEQVPRSHFLTAYQSGATQVPQAFPTGPVLVHSLLVE